jgi:hypothetical protein
MPQSITNFDAALKDDYGPGLRESINNSNPVWTEATRNDEDIVGRQAVWSIHTGRSTSTGARAELSALPSADRQRYSQAKENLAFLYHTIKVSGPAKQLTRNDTGAFTRAMEAELDGAEKDLRTDCARQAFGDVVTVASVVSTGVLAKVSGGSTTTPTLTAPNGNPITASEMRYFFINESVDVINGATGAVRGTQPIASINAAAGTITFAAAIAGTAANDFIVRSGSFQAEMLGLRALISNSNVIANIDPAVVPTWASVAVGSTSTAVSEVLFDQATEGVETDGDGNTPSLYISEHAQRRKLAQLLQAQKRFDGRETTLTAGWVGLQVARGTLRPFLPAAGRLRHLPQESGPLRRPGLHLGRGRRQDPVQGARRFGRSRGTVQELPTAHDDEPQLARPDPDGAAGLLGRNALRAIPSGRSHQPRSREATPGTVSSDTLDDYERSAYAEPRLRLGACRRS